MVQVDRSSLRIGVELSYRLREPSPLLMQIEPADTDGQTVLSVDLDYKQGKEQSRLAADDGIGQRIWAHADQAFEIEFQAVAAITRKGGALSALDQTPVHQLPADVVKYLLASRYCPLQNLDELMAEISPGGPAGEVVEAASNWVHNAIAYLPGASNGNTTAIDTMRDRCGICRDYAHVLISMCRAAMIPARYVSLYSPDVYPMDFHACVQVFLQGEWRLIDPTQMSVPDRTAIIGVGRDANDVSFLTSFAEAEFVRQVVTVEVDS